MQRNHRAAEQECDRRLQFALVPAERLFQWHNQGAKAVEQGRIDTNGNADYGEQEDSPSAAELTEVDCRFILGGRHGLASFIGFVGPSCGEMRGYCRLMI
ncbi:hypothetical protein D3C81_2097140 [compost metagenome]